LIVLATVFCSKWESLLFGIREAMMIIDYNIDSCTYLRNWTEMYYRSEVQAYFEGSALV